MGTFSVEATSTDSDLTYESIPNFQDGVKMWANRDDIASGVNGVEECEGGNYLQPSVSRVSHRCYSSECIDSMIMLNILNY